MAKPCANDTELAEAIHLSSRRIREMRREHPDAPATRDPAAWIAFCDAKGLRAPRSENKTRLQEENLRLDAELKRVKLREAEGAVVGVAEMGDFVARFSAKLDQLLTQKIETELPVRMQGKEIVAMRAEARAIHDEIREIYNAGLLEWQPKY